VSFALLLPLLALSQHGGEKITVEEAVQRTLKVSPGLQGTFLRRDAALAQSDSLRGRLGPLLAVSWEWDHYSQPFALSFFSSSTPLPAPFSAFSKPIVARNVVTSTFAATAQQPIVGLFRTWEERASAATNAEAVAEAARAVQAAVREQVENGYLHYFESKAAEEIALTSQQQLEEQAQLVVARLKAGTATNADKLRLDVAISNAKQQRIQAQAQQDATRIALLLAMELPSTSDAELVEPKELEDRALPNLDDSTAIAKAVQNRPEVAQAVKAHDAAVRHTNASYLALLPEVSVDATWLNIRGQVFAPENQLYVGLKASWPFWDWGATYYQGRVAEKQAEAAEQDVVQQKFNVATEASSRWVQAKAARTAVDAAETAIASAEEAYRVMQALVNAGTATTTDLLDAQSSLTQAKANLLRARYTQAEALVALQKALGG
jgi:outer membrane protein